MSKQKANNKTTNNSPNQSNPRQPPISSKSQDLGFDFAAEKKKSTNLSSTLSGTEKKEDRPKSKKQILKEGGIVHSRGPREAAGGVTVKEWQRLPKQLLQEYCQREKRPRPFFPKARCDDPSLFRHRAILPDPKGNQAKDLNFLPSAAYPSQQEAEEYASLLALHHLQPSLPLERKFPEPYAAAWISLVKSNTTGPQSNQSNNTINKSNDLPNVKQKTKVSKVNVTSPTTSSSGDSTSSFEDGKDDEIEISKSFLPQPGLSNVNIFVSQHERDRVNETRRKRDNERERTKSVKERDWITVFMSEENRVMIENIIKSFQMSNSNPLYSSPSSPSPLSPINFDTQPYNDIITKLLGLQFSLSDIQHALTVVSLSPPTYYSTLDYLCLHLPEDQLPTQFSAVGKQFEVFSHEKEDARELLKILGTGRMGVPLWICDKSIKESNGNLDTSLRLIYESIYKDFIDKTNLTLETNTFNLDEIEEEIMALESIYGKDFHRATTKQFSIHLTLPPPNNSLTLTVYLIPTTSLSSYPNNFPILIYYSEHLSATQRLQLVLYSAEYIVKNNLMGTGYIYQLSNWLITEWKDIFAMIKSKPLQVPNSFVNNEIKKQLLAPSPSPVATTPTGENTYKLNSIGLGKNKHQCRIVQNSNIDQDMVKKWSNVKQSLSYKKLVAARSQLPVSKERDKFVDYLHKNQVLICSASTGSGKSTQIPQFILDDAIDHNEGSTCNIFVTQPRRISAIGLAGRVAEERGGEVGNSVGYIIKGDNQTSASTRITYVTTGVLLRQLVNDKYLSNISHLCIDEVHERTVEIDFLLIIIKHLLKIRPKTFKLILMSATLNAQLFSTYFNDAPVLNVEGKIFPVTEFYLEDLLEITNFNPDHRYRRNINSKVNAEKLIELSDNIKNNLPIDQAAQYSDKTINLIASIYEEKINLDFIKSIVFYALDNHQGSILVFLPGLYEINKLTQLMKKQIFEKDLDPANFLIMPLHSSLSTTAQNRIWQVPNKGTRKIILSTNIAETSITIDDIGIVIDSGKSKEITYNKDKNITNLQESWISQANASQRKGRAGRVTAGVCYRCFSYYTFNCVMMKQQLPEIYRIPLDHLCLQIKLLNLDSEYRYDDKCSNIQINGRGGCERILSQAVQPPTSAAIQAAITELIDLGAFTNEEELTPLGQHLARLPVNNCKLGKLLVFGAVLECTRSIAIIASLLMEKSPFLSPPYDKREEVNKLHARYSAGSKSDHLGLLRVYEEWNNINLSNGADASKSYCDANYLSHSILDNANKSIDQMCNALKEIGFEARNNQGSNNSILLAVLAAGLYPNVIRVKHPADTYVQTAFGTAPLQHKSKDIKFYVNHRQLVKSQEIIKHVTSATELNQTILEKKEQFQLPNPSSQKQKMLELDPASKIDNSNNSIRVNDTWDEDWDEDNENNNTGGGEIEDDADEFEKEKKGEKMSTASTHPITTISAFCSSSPVSMPSSTSSFDDRVFLHPSSVNFNSTSFDSPWLVYLQLMSTDRVWVYDTSMVSPYSILLFGGVITTNLEKGLIIIDDWITFRAPARIAVLIRHLRTLFDLFLLQKLERPNSDLSVNTSTILTAIFKLLTTNGF